MAVFRLAVVEDDVGGAGFEAALVDQAVSLVARPIGGQGTSASSPGPVNFVRLV